MVTAKWTAVFEWLPVELPQQSRKRSTIWNPCHTKSSPMLSQSEAKQCWLLPNCIGTGLENSPRSFQECLSIFLFARRVLFEGPSKIVPNTKVKFLHRSFCDRKFYTMLPKPQLCLVQIFLESNLEALQWISLISNRLAVDCCSSTPDLRCQWNQPRKASLRRDVVWSSRLVDCSLCIHLKMEKNCI